MYSNVRPAALTVSTSAAALKTVRKTGLRRSWPKADWSHALTPATSIVSSVPMSSRAAKSTLYETERLDELGPSGTRSRRLDANADAASKVANSAGFTTCLGPHSASTAAPAAMISATKNVAASGWDRAVSSGRYGRTLTLAAPAVNLTRGSLTYHVATSVPHHDDASCA